MSIWRRIAAALSALAEGEPLSVVFDKLRTPPERTVAFTIAIIALSAKMAKADGRVTRAEVAAFREVFFISSEEEKNAARVFNLARTDVAGYDGYARRIAGMFEKGSAVLEDLLEGLFHIAAADGAFHPEEDAFLSDVADIFGVERRAFLALRSRYAPDAEPDPYTVLGVDPDVSDEDLTARWRALVRETHPDRMMARGVPEEATKLATARLVAVNQAYEAATAERSASSAT